MINSVSGAIKASAHVSERRGLPFLVVSNKAGDTHLIQSVAFTYPKIHPHICGCSVIFSATAIIEIAGQYFANCSIGLMTTLQPSYF